MRNPLSLIFFLLISLFMENAHYLLVLPIARLRSRRRTKPTRYCDSLDTTTGKPLCSVSLSSVSTSSTVIESWVSTFNGSLCLEQYVIYYSKIHLHSGGCTNNLCTTAIYRPTVLFLSKIHLLAGVHLQCNAEFVNNLRLLTHILFHEKKHQKQKPTDIVNYTV